MSLAEKVQSVASARKELAMITTEHRAALAEFREEHAGLIADLDNAKLNATMAEAALREAALAASLEEIKATNGVKIRNVKTVKYDTHAAVRYAYEKQEYLIFDSKEFERVMKILRPESRPKFVTIETVRQATIDKDLSGVI